MARNQYAGTCYQCGLTVEPNTGHFERHQGSWRTKHANVPAAGRVTCWQARDAASNTEIHISTPPSRLARSIKAQ